MIVVSRETTAHTGRDQYENGAGKNRPQTFHGKNNKRFAGKGQSFVAADEPAAIGLGWATADRGMAANRRKRHSAAKPQPKELNHGFHGFHGFRIPHPRRPRNGIGTEANEEEFLLRFLRSLLFKKIRVIRAIRGEIFSKMSDSHLLSHKGKEWASEQG
ncbi:MAG: hypothetical protein ABSC18_17200 [Verrucomicrobiota bacterium]